ncbi:MAG: hydroxyethylthiazole kinase [Selenomonadaceae bacterium]
MINKTTFTDKIAAVRHQVKNHTPLIHCLTNHISINDCANVILTVGAKPIMAEHPAEVADITTAAKALVLNLGNISETRMQAMNIAGKVAQQKGLPITIDLVGVACSTLRLAFAREFIATCKPAIVKGNISELKAFGGLSTSAEGIDASPSDMLTDQNAVEVFSFLKNLSQRTGSIIAVTGKTDIISDGQNIYLLANGCEMLSAITGTGCMINALAGAFLAGGAPLIAAISALSLMAISGELAAAKAAGPGSFKIHLLDNLFCLQPEELTARLRLTVV